MNDRKITAMHKHYGKNGFGKCGDCCNFIEFKIHGKKYRKCEYYGVSNSVQTDWAKKYDACLKYNEPFALSGRRPLSKILRSTDNDSLEGQIDMFGVD